MKQIRQRLTYANVMSSIAVFFVLGGATAFAATKVGTNEIKANSIKTGKIVKEAVTAGKIKNAAVGTSKLGNGAVATDKIAENAITTAKIADNAVTTPKISAIAVTAPKIANDAVAATKLAKGAVTSEKLAAGAVGAGKLGTIQRVIAESATTNAVGQTREVTATCPAGTVAISGGAAWVTTTGSTSTVNGILRVSQPVPSTAGTGAPTGWQATGETDAAFERRLRAYAICLTQ